MEWHNLEKSQTFVDLIKSWYEGSAKNRMFEGEIVKEKLNNIRFPNYKGGHFVLKILLPMKYLSRSSLCPDCELMRRDYI